MQARNDNDEHHADAPLAKANGSLQTLELDFGELFAFLNSNKQIQRFLASTTIESKGKRLAVEAILEGRTKPILIDFIFKLLTSNDKAECYADTLIALGRANGSLQTLELDFGELLAFLNSNEKIQRFLASTTIKSKGKRLAVKEILEGRINQILIDFICMLLTSNDLKLVDQIADIFFEKASLDHKHVTGEIHSARKLSASQVEEIEREVGRILNKKLNLHPKVMPDILGGILVKVGDFLLDGTIDKQLIQAKQHLLV